MITHIEIERIKVKYFDPGNPMSRLVFKDPKVCKRFDFAIVDNNADPEKKGRLKVRFPHWGNIITNWIPMIRLYASKNAGVWMLPDVGTQVICVFFNDCTSRPIVIGSVYTPRVHAPVNDNESNNLKMLTTKGGSQIIFDDTNGEEKLLIQTKNGAMRIALDPKKGLSIVNEKGNISIKCRKLIVKSKDDAYITINKEFSLSAEETISKKAKSNFSIKSGKDVVFKAKSKINIKGNLGVTAGVKQMAKKNDLVVGIDMHDIQVPSNSGLTTVPMVPHPYLGKLADKLSQNVTINDQPAAIKGSKSKYDTPGHMCMPPGVKFKKNPNNEGEVSSGTVGNVKINDKEAAVLGSMVKTCNDPREQETCSIIAAGAPVILPILMPGMDEEEFKKKGGTQFNIRTPITTMEKTAYSRIQPKLQNPQWSAETVSIEEEVTLSVELVDQYDFANVTFAIWEEGADREKDNPVAVLKASNIDGKAEVKWIKKRYFSPPKKEPDELLMQYVKKMKVSIPPEKLSPYLYDIDEPIDQQPGVCKKYVFTCSSFRCKKIESSPVTIGDSQKIRIRNVSGTPIKNLKYKMIDPEGNETEGTFNDKGEISNKGVKPGIYKIRVHLKEGKK